MLFRRPLTGSHEATLDAATDVDLGARPGSRAARPGRLTHRRLSTLQSSLEADPLAGGGSKPHLGWLSTRRGSKDTPFVSYSKRRSRNAFSSYVFTSSQSPVRRGHRHYRFLARPRESQRGPKRRLAPPHSLPASPCPQAPQQQSAVSSAVVLGVTAGSAARSGAALVVAASSPVPGDPPRASASVGLPRPPQRHRSTRRSAAFGPGPARGPVASARRRAHGSHRRDQQRKCQLRARHFARSDPCEAAAIHVLPPAPGDLFGTCLADMHSRWWPHPDHLALLDLVERTMVHWSDLRCGDFMCSDPEGLTF